MCSSGVARIAPAPIHELAHSSALRNFFSAYARLERRAPSVKARMLQLRRHTRRHLMSLSRVLILLVFTVATMSTLSHAQSVGRSTRQPAIDLTRIDALNRNVVAADFNCDGIIDLAVSRVSFAGVS